MSDTVKKNILPLAQGLVLLAISGIAYFIYEQSKTLNDIDKNLAVLASQYNRDHEHLLALQKKYEELKYKIKGD